jgi:uncharacterized protein
VRLDDVVASTRVEDRRRGGLRGGAIGGGALLIGILALLLGGDPSVLLNQIGTGGADRPITAEEEALATEAKKVLRTTEEVWEVELPRQRGVRYEPPNLVLFSGIVQSACGRAGSAVGPFYCPADRRAYLDLSFFDELDRRFGASGDFARAYVIAHEIGHHVQNVLGISDRVHELQQRVSKTEANRLSVRLELQADFLAGVWAHHANKRRPILEDGDVDEAIRAAEAIGDDRLQRQSQGTVVPDSFTHGTSAQRAAWFRHGLRTGDLREGDTFDDAVFSRVDPR